MPLRRPRVQPQAVLVYHVNINGLGPRREELRAATSAASVISLQDTRLRDPAAAAELWRAWWPDHQVYDFAHDNAGPGCALLVRSSLRQRLLHRRTERRHRFLTVEVELADGLQLRVSSLYVPPRSNADGSRLRRDFLEEALDSRWSVLVGDLNARSEELGCRSTNINGAALFDFIEESGSVVLNDPSVPTFDHVSSSFSDCLDWALATPAVSSLFSCFVGEDVGSDHLPLVVSRPTAATPPPCTSDALRRWRTSSLGWTEAFSRTLERELSERSLTSRPVPSSPAEVDSLAEEVEAALACSADACLERSRHRSLGASLPLPWWARLLVRQRRRLRRHLRRCDAAEAVEVRRQLGVLRRDVARAVRQARQERLQRKATVFARGPRDPLFWPAVRSWFRGPPPQLPPLQRPGEETPATCPTDRASTFAQHLARALSVGRHPDYDDAFFAEVEGSVDADPLFRPLAGLEDEPAWASDAEEPAGSVSPYLVSLTIKRLRGGKAPGPDGISSDLLKAAPFGLAVALATVFTGSLRVGHVPPRWRVAWIRMLPKPGKALSSAVDFRPVALTSCVGKVLERIFARRLLDFCGRHSLLPEEQSGFRPARDTLEQVVLLAQRATQALNGGLCVAVAALDVAKAYDSVWHGGLLHQLREVLTEPSSRWIASFLRGRSAAVLEEGYLSEQFATPGGVPQGSPLSPLLYVLFTRTMPLPRGQRLGATAYADDVAVWAAAESPAAAWAGLEPHLASLVAWGLQWRLHFSAEKTQAAFFSRRQGGWTPEQLGEPVFATRALPWKQAVDLLGVRVDRRLQLQSHARWLAQRIGPRLLDLRRLLESQRRVPAWVGLLLYRSLVRPCLTYAAPVLSLACDSAWDLLDRTERRGFRAALRLRRDSDVDDLYRRTAALGRLKEVCRRLGSRFLLRHHHHGNLRLLSAFRTEVDQHSDRLHVSGPLERLLAWCPPADRATISATVRDHIYPPDRQLQGRRSRARLLPVTPVDWGVSPFG